MKNTHLLTILKTSTLPKIINIIEDSEKQQNFRFYINSQLPSKSLGYISEEDFLNDNNLRKEDIIQNSIKYSLTDINDEDLSYLVNAFLHISLQYKARIINDDVNNTIYLEIINILEYIKQIQSIFTKALQRSDFLGTANRNSSFKKRINRELSMLEERLEHPFFSITDTGEREKIAFQIKFMKYVLKNNKNIIELFNYHRVLFGLKNKINDFTDIEISGLEELLNFFNGLRTDSYKLLNSVLLYINIQSNPALSRLPNEYQNSVYNIARFFFDDEIKNYDKNNKRTIVFSTYKMKQQYTINTFLYDIPIYTTKKKGNSVLEFFQDEAIKDIFGLKNIFDESKPKEETQHNFQRLRSIIFFKQTMGFSKDDIKALSYLISLIEKNQLEGNIPPN